MNILLVDNYDSYTYNLYQLLAQVTGSTPTVIRNDDVAWAALDLHQFTAIVISPGPGHPACERDFGHSRTALDQALVPVLGVCLGHQGLGLMAGACIGQAPKPRHGHLSAIRHSGSEIFEGLPQGFQAVRYHSLCISEPLPEELEAIAWSEDGVIMAVRHRRLPQWGVQFHPESISTEHSAELLRNFCRIAYRPHKPVQHPPRIPSTATDDSSRPDNVTELLLQYVCIDRLLDAEQVFHHLYGERHHAFWLDSSLVEPGLSRFSFIGAPEGPSGETLTYRVDDRTVVIEDVHGNIHSESGSIFQALERRLKSKLAGAEALPFEFCGGYVGYFGYELKAELGGTAAFRASTPDALWMRADHLVAFDHEEKKTYVLAATTPPHKYHARKWVTHTAEKISSLDDDQSIKAPHPNLSDPTEWMLRSPSQYIADIESCLRHLYLGESYEICLTTQFKLPAPPYDLTYYSRLRRINPAPYSALIHSGDLAVFCSSPERFLHVNRQGIVESKPIKGTVPRGADRSTDERLRDALRSDSKTRAENLMIVDLLRNDLGRVCEIGSVHVPRFMATESYATVHQLVSTIRGRLRESVSAVACAAACFPGGSMTGAPKLRTMEIIDALEQHPRGIYSGALGYFAFGGAADLNIVIRTAVRHGRELTVGAGGAIVLDSDPVAEYEEMTLKARAPLRGLPIVEVV